MVSNPLVSVIVPLYNKGRYVQRAIASILGQTLGDLELIVVDDGSTDGGAELVRAIDDARLHLIQQPNQGPGAARNRGLAIARAPWVSFLDADDEWLPEFLAHSLGQLQRHPDCALAVSGQYRGAERRDWGERLRSWEIQPGPWRLSLTVSPLLLKPNLDVLHSGAIVARRQVVQSFGGFYSRDHCSYGEDIYLWLQVMLAYPLYRDPQPLIWYHTECSELGVWNREHCPIWPMLLDPDPLRQRCPVDYQPILEQYLAHYAILAARRLVQGEITPDRLKANRMIAQQLLAQFPLSRAFSRDYYKANIEILLANFPELRAMMGRAKLSSWAQHSQHSRSNH